MNIVLKNVQHSAFASQETNCFAATIYIDGARAGSVKNDGHGGPNHYTPWELHKRINDYAKTLPKHVCDFLDPNTGCRAVISQTADMLIDDLLNDHLEKAQLRRLCSRKTLF